MIHLNFVVAIINNVIEKWGKLEFNDELIKNYEKVIFDILIWGEGGGENWLGAGMRFYLTLNDAVMKKLFNPDLMSGVKCLLTFAINLSATSSRNELYLDRWLLR